MKQGNACVITNLTQFDIYRKFIKQGIPYSMDFALFDIY